MSLKSPIKPAELITNFLSSIITGAFGFWLVYLLQGLIKLYFSYDFDIVAKFTMQGVQFATPDNDPLWTRDAIVTVFLAPSIFFFFGGLFFLFLLGMVKRKSPTLLFFFLWADILFNGSAYGIIIEQGVAHSGLYRVAEALNVGLVPLIIAVSVSIYFLYLTGIITAKLIFLNADESWKSNGRLKLSLFFIFFLLPFLLNLILFIFYGEIKTAQIITFGLSLIVILPVLWTSPPKNNNFNIEPPSPFNLMDGITLLLLLVFMFLIYASLKHGIELPLTFKL